MSCPHIKVYTKVLGEFVPISCPYCARDAQQARDAKSAVISRCWFCEGLCECEFPVEGIDGENLPGFEAEGLWITSPNRSECMRFYVDPIKAYGAPFIEWAQKHPDLLARLSDEKRRLITEWKLP